MARIRVTEYLDLDLDGERWRCRVCDHDLGSARENYKHACRINQRDPREIHKPLLDPARYTFTYSPNPEWCRILEYYCPKCGTMIETEYLPPGHPPVRDIELDIDALKAQWKDRLELPEAHAKGPLAGRIPGGLR